MTAAQKHIILVDADLEAQVRFKSNFSSKEVEIIAFTSGMGAIQYIKQTGAPDLLVLEEAAKPLGAVQTLNYLKDQIAFTAPVVVISENLEEDTIAVQAQKVITKPFKCEDIAFIKELLMLKELAGAEEEKYYKLDYLKELAEGDTDFIKESLKIFIQTVPPQIEELTQNHASENFKQVGQLAHAVKPSFEMLQNYKAAKICDDLAHHAQPDEMEHLVDQLLQEHQQIITSLKADFSDL
ncbi:MAG: Hpt domain-containing protein [Bacteroidota bacterium]|nr:Hpt domain-containing protein [Bacteroidota bacterium]